MDSLNRAGAVRIGLATSTVAPKNLAIESVFNGSNEGDRKKNAGVKENSLRHFPRRPRSYSRKMLGEKPFGYANFTRMHVTANGVLKDLNRLKSWMAETAPLFEKTCEENHAPSSTMPMDKISAEIFVKEACQEQICGPLNSVKPVVEVSLWLFSLSP